VDDPLKATSKSPSWVRSPIRYAWWWWTTKRSTNANGLIVSLVGIVLGAALAALASLLLHVFGPAGRVPGYALTVGCAVALVVGGVAAWQITRRLYELEVQARDSALAARDTEVKAVLSDLAKAEKLLDSLEPDREALRRMTVYFDHICDVFEGILRGDVPLDALESPKTRDLICGVPERQMRAIIGDTVKISIWREPPQSRVMETLKHLPSVISDRLGSFEIVAAPSHSLIETEAFAVHIDSSWIKHNHRCEIEYQDHKVYRADSLRTSGHRANDLQTFMASGFDSVRATSFGRDGRIGYIVVLAQGARPFSLVEERYVLLLRYILEVSGRLNPA
jgi:hypothetical protein